VLTPAEHHERSHTLLSQPTPPMDECRRCQRSIIKCGGKITYPDPWAAWDLAMDLNVRRGKDSLVLPYRCRHCMLWHLTSRLNKHRTRRAEKHRRKQLRSA
jgi:hypothetical protein